MTLTAVVVGLGGIGQNFDYDTRSPGRVLTHTSAFHHHPGFKLIGGVDPDANARERFTRKYQAPAFASLAGLAALPDVFALAVPTPQHHATLTEALLFSPRAVICEKPIAYSLEEAEAMVTMADEAKCALLVNYMRRFDPRVQAIRTIIRNNELGEYKALGLYRKGFLHNASHFVDLLAYLLGPFTEGHVLAHHGGNDTDPELDVQLRFGGVPAYLLNTQRDGADLTRFELLGTRGVWSYQFDRCYQTHVLNGLEAHLQHGAPLASSGNTALETLRICVDTMAGVCA